MMLWMDGDISPGEIFFNMDLHLCDSIKFINLLWMYLDDLLAHCVPWTKL